MSDAISPRVWLRTEEAASHVGLSRSTLEKLRLTGGGPPFAKAGPRIVVYDLDALNAWLSARTRNSTAEPIAGIQPQGKVAEA